LKSGFRWDLGDWSMGSERPRHETLQAAERLMSAHVVEWQPVVGGYSANRRWLVMLDTGRTLFAKEAVNDDTRRWLDRERMMYEAVTADFMPEYLGSDVSGEDPAVLIEDLSAAEWPPPWSDQRTD